MSFKNIIILPLVLAFMVLGIGSAHAQIPATVVGVQLATTGLTNPLVSGQSAILARLVLDTTGSQTPVRIASLPLSLTLGAGATSTSLANCQVINEATGAALSSGTNVPTTLISGMNTFTLDNPIVLPAGALTTLDVRCNVASNLVSGGTFQFSLNTADVVAINPATGAPAVVTLRGAVNPVIVPVINPVIVPNVPNTGAGGEASTNILIILGSLAAASLGLAYARKAAR